MKWRDDELRISAEKIEAYEKWKQYFEGLLNESKERGSDITTGPVMTVRIIKKTDRTSQLRDEVE